ncbi:Peptidase aspartic [Akanthomyces lecanii RCEF 1005]|uniref:Peptidase aspartic n=1 Tax=Akanthomyces lecanii RCEF 1005 TaxID=1081108 RepID=A0A168G2D1_CORDF|nr:Peptidase aspartic [Akanthomyces lecanii RCEF 1005]
MVVAVSAESTLHGEPNQFIGIETNETSKAKPYPWKSYWTDTGGPNSRSVGSWPLTFHPSPYGHRFTVPVQLGDPPQRSDLDVHTSMATTWVTGKSCYVPNNKSVIKVHKKGYQNFELSFPDWTTVDGTVYQDRARIGDGENAIGYWIQEFGVAKTIHPRFVYERKLSGVLGLGPKYDSGKRLPASLLTALGKTDFLWSWRFSMTFKEEGGHMDWGWRNESRYTGELLKFWHSNTKVKKHVPNAHHTINTSAVYIGQEIMRSRRALTAGIDSTSSYIALPYPMAVHHYKKLGKRAARKFLLPDDCEGWILSSLHYKLTLYSVHTA